MRTLTLPLVVLASAVSCVHAPRVLSVGRDPYMFWPPPRATSVSEAPVATSTMGEAASMLASTLRDAGYVDVRWYPIGGHYEHGFAVTTRLERPEASERWPAGYPDPVELRWLEAASPELPGHHRALLVAFTDLPPAATGQAPIWDATTVMETGNPPSPLPISRVTSSRFRIATFVYDYAR